MYDLNSPAQKTSRAFAIFMIAVFSAFILLAVYALITQIPHQQSSPRRVREPSRPESNHSAPDRRGK